MNTVKMNFEWVMKFKRILITRRRIERFLHFSVDDGCKFVKRRHLKMAAHREMDDKNKQVNKEPFTVYYLM